MDADSYLADRKTPDAVVRNFEVIGEARNNSPSTMPSLRIADPEIPWNFA